MYRHTLAAFLLFAGAAVAEPPKVPGPLKLAVGEDAAVTVKVPAGKKAGFHAAFDPSECTFFRGWSDAADEMTFLVRPKKSGKYRVVFWTVDETASSELVIDAGQPDPTPPGPTPPGPTPPGPTPDPGAPFAGVSGLHVLILYESADLAKLPTGQQAIVFSKDGRSFLDSVTPAGPDGKTHEWRMWDKDVSAASEAKHWQDALAKFKPAQTPWLLVGNGAAGFSGPLPADVAAFQALVNKYKVAP